jgi:hypothetical protein
MMNRPQGNSAAIRIKSINNSNDPIDNRTPKLPASSPVPQPTAPPCTPILLGGQGIFFSPKSIQTSPGAYLVSSKRALCGGKASGVWRWPPTPNLALGLCFMACYRENVTFYSSSYHHSFSNLLVNGETHQPSRDIDEWSRAPHNSIIRSHLYNY